MANSVTTPRYKFDSVIDTEFFFVCKKKERDAMDAELIEKLKTVVGGDVGKFVGDHYHELLALPSIEDVKGFKYPSLDEAEEVLCFLYSDAPNISGAAVKQVADDGEEFQVIICGEKKAVVTAAEMLNNYSVQGEEFEVDEGVARGVKLRRITAILDTLVNNPTEELEKGQDFSYRAHYGDNNKRLAPDGSLQDHK